MAVTEVTLPIFAPDGSVGAAFGAASSRVALPGTPSGDTVVVVSNLSSIPVYVALGDVTVVAVVGTGGFLVMPGKMRAFARGTATYIAGIIQGGSTYASLSDAVCAIETGN